MNRKIEPASWGGQGIYVGIQSQSISHGKQASTSAMNSIDNRVALARSNGSPAKPYGSLTGTPSGQDEAEVSDYESAHQQTIARALHFDHKGTPKAPEDAWVPQVFDSTASHLEISCLRIARVIGLVRAAQRPFGP
jgi:hypothetical protein